MENSLLSTTVYATELSMVPTVSAAVNHHLLSWIYHCTAWTSDTNEYSQM